MKKTLFCERRRWNGKEKNFKDAFLVTASSSVIGEGILRFFSTHDALGEVKRTSLENLRRRERLADRFSHSLTWFPSRPCPRARASTTMSRSPLGKPFFFIGEITLPSAACQGHFVVAVEELGESAILETEPCGVIVVEGAVRKVD